MAHAGRTAVKREYVTRALGLGAVLALAFVLFRRARRYADPDVSVYGHP